MIISNRYNFIFLKNPKTGGTSIQKSLSYMDQSPMEYSSTLSVIKTGVAIDSTYYGKINIVVPAPYLNLYHLDRRYGESILNMNVYVTIREPVDRFLSLCRHIRDYGFVARTLFNDRLDRFANGPERDMNPNIRWTPELFSTFSPGFRDAFNSITLQEIAEKVIDAPFYTNSIFLDFLRIPQSYYYNHPRVKILNYANLQNDFNKMLSDNNAPETELQTHNVGIKLPSDDLSLETIEKIKAAYAEDIEFYSTLN